MESIQMVRLDQILAAGAGAAAAGVSVFLWMAAREAIVVNARVTATRIVEQSACNDRVAQIERKVNAAADQRIAEAIEAAREIEETPEAPDEIKELCRRSASCRSRDKLQ